ncbi:hypothetical protein [Microbacterium marinilacus]|uniref:ABC transporter ATP-binding protein n=1 Tax=Microbacterium marinilacus TaxID=415209 RepID=A0ABP7B6X5_9MICO|nr:hypothetical protein [Microbacterium marinilacus]MBY0687448.1 hypothetical protein [Microbacterium marinilacus]
MRLSARGISKGRALPETTVHVRGGQVRVVPVEGGQRPTVLGLVLSGRMSPDTGEVTIDGEADHRRLRNAVALVDAPDVSAPPDDLRLADVVREELRYAGVRGARAATARLLSQWGAAGEARTRVHDVPAAVRLRVLAEAATLRPGVEAVVIVSPDRHGGDPVAWRAVADDLASRGLAVLVLAGRAAIEALGVDVDTRPLPHALDLDAPGREPAAPDEVAFEEAPPESGTATVAPDAAPEALGDDAPDARDEEDDAPDDEGRAADAPIEQNSTDGVADPAPPRTDPEEGTS